MKIRFIAISFLLLGNALFADRLVNIGAGVFNIVKGTKYPILQIEYRGDTEIYRRKYFWIRPLAGAFITTKASTYLFGGLAFDIFLGSSWAFTPSFAPGIYFQAKGKDLGYPLEFRSSAELSYIFTSKNRLGLQFYHISNGTFGTTNPGTECLLAYYGIHF